MAGRQKTILITGCSSGIGYDAASTLKMRGWRVFATCRQEEDCERLRSEGHESFRLDYSDEESIKSAVTTTLERTENRLDAVFNNGAFAIPGAVEDLPREALRQIFEVNLFGYFDVIRQVAPIMNAQGHGRIINCSSVLGFIALPARGAYVATKFALEALSDTMRLEYKRVGKPIDVILIEPGPITTKFRENSVQPFFDWIDWENSQNRDLYEHELIPRLKEHPVKLDPGERPPSAVTRKLIKALEAKKPRARYYVTPPTYLADIMRRFLPTRALDMILKG